MYRVVKQQESYLMDGFVNANQQSTCTGIDVAVGYFQLLNSELDIFKDLPKEVYQYVNVRLFLNELRLALVSQDLQGVPLTELCVDKYTATELELVWIYTNFRVYFAFSLDGSDTDCYGKVYINTVEGVYKSENGTLPQHKYRQVANEMVSAVVHFVSGYKEVV